MGNSLPSPTDLICSFCHKPQKAVRKLISAPRGTPRAYICDECVAVCTMIIEQDDGAVTCSPESDQPDEELHPLSGHPLVSQLLTAIERWIRRESLGADVAQDFAEVRSIVSRMMRS